MKSSLLVDGVSNLNNAVNISLLPANGDALTVNGTSILSGAVTMSQSLLVSGASNLNNGATITRNPLDGNALTVTGSAMFNNDVTINGNLTVLGSQTTIDTVNLQVKDNAILIADQNQSDSIQSGIMVQYKPTGSANVMYAGLRRQPNSGEFVFYKDATAQIGTSDQTASNGVPGAVVADSFNCASDARLKKNIVNLDGALDKIDNIRGVYHDWIDEAWGKERQIGVIAQEVQAIYPELVQEGGNGYLSVNYPKLTAVLLQSIKELKAMVVALA